MTFVRADRVLESTTSTGTGAKTLAGAITGYRTWDDVCADNDLAPYSIWAVDSVGQPTGDWETGIGTYAAGDVTPLTVIASSNGGAAVDFAAGTKRIAISDLAHFGWRDITGDVTLRGAGGSDPTWAVYRNGIRQYQFSVNDEVWFVYHVPHDWAYTDIFIHAHWSHASAAVASGGVTWGFEVTAAKGFNQQAFGATVSTSVQQNASTTQYQHMVAEVQLSSDTPSGSQINNSLLEPDSLILVRCFLQGNTINGTPEPFLHTVDIHYQSSNVATPNKAPSFY